MPGVAVAGLRHLLAVLTGSHRKAVGAYALVTDTEGRVLMVRNAYGTRFWNLPGGRIERHERPHDGVVREVREETGLDVRVEHLAVVDTARPESVVLTFRCAVVGGSFTPAPGEIGALHWMTDAELATLPPRRRWVIGLALSSGGAVHYIH